MNEALSKYDLSKSYDWNYEHAPPFPIPSSLGETSGAVDRLPPDRLEWSFCGIPVSSPLGIAAGPLLNGRWVLQYANAGFDVLTYKTVRSRYRQCYAQPNLQPIRENEVSAPQEVWAARDPQNSWAISFGMPSKAPQEWTEDVAWTRKHLPKHKVLSVSVVASAEPDWSIREVADDYALCARMAVENGADCVELNLSCPNVSSIDGQLYQDVTAARTTVEVTRDAIREAPLLVKVGYIETERHALELFNALAGLVNGIAMTNCIACTVRNGDTIMFDGQPRGIGGAAIRTRSVDQVRMCAAVTSAVENPPQIIGVGGAFTEQDVQDYLDAGASHVHLATAAMLNPTLGLRLAETSYRQKDWTK